MNEYPSLRNPINLEVLSFIIALFSLLLGIITLFVACTILKKQRAEQNSIAKIETYNSYLQNTKSEVTFPHFYLDCV